MRKIRVDYPGIVSNAVNLTLPCSLATPRRSAHIDKQNTGPFYATSLGDFKEGTGGISVEVRTCKWRIGEPRSAF